MTLRLTDDWQGADFIAQHVDGETFLKVQLKGRLVLDRKYIGKSLLVAFPYIDHWYLYPHDEVLEHLLNTTNIGNTESWLGDGHYSMKSISKEIRGYLEQYAL